MAYVLTEPSALCVVNDSGVTAINLPCWLSGCCGASAGGVQWAAVGASGDTNSTIAAASTLDTPTDAAIEPTTRLDLDTFARCFPLMGLSPLGSLRRCKRGYQGRPWRNTCIYYGVPSCAKRSQIR